MNVGANLGLSGLGCNDCGGTCGGSSVSQYMNNAAPDQVVPDFLGTNGITYPIDGGSVKTQIPFLLRENTPQRYAAIMDQETGNINLPQPVNIELTPLPSIVNLPSALASAVAASSNTTLWTIGALAAGLWLFGKGR